jgi:putative SOS response-associated peptidase YedK
MRRIHNRMPVIYDEPMGRQWLKEQHGDRTTDLAAVMRPWPVEYMEAHDVSDLVNAPENDSPECIKPLPSGYIPRGQLPLV